MSQKSQKSVRVENGNTDHSQPVTTNQCIKWCFTWNNYENPEEFINRLDRISKKVMCQEEIGENNTPHLQGAVWLKKRMRMTELKKLNNKVHWSVMRNEDKAGGYCLKEETRNGKQWITGKRPLRPCFNGGKPYPWQQKVIDICAVPCDDDRTVHWIWGHNGCKGKSNLCKYLCRTFNCCVVAGKNADILYGVTKHIEKREEIDVLVIDCPRTWDEKEFVSMQAVEKIKDGLFFSGKFESCMVDFNPPHLFVFANCEPRKNTLSEDRWNITCLDENENDNETFVKAIRDIALMPVQLNTHNRDLTGDMGGGVADVPPPSPLPGPSFRY